LVSAEGNNKQAEKSSAHLLPSTASTQQMAFFASSWLEKTIRAVLLLCASTLHIAKWHRQLALA
jgi:hypothetical protein